MKFHVGCGKRNFGEDWVHVDGGDFDHLSSHDIFLKDYPDNSADLIYASHVIEYFDRQELNLLLKIWHDKCRPGGILRVAVPDFEVMASLYLHNKFTLSSFLGPLYGRMEMSGKLIYHKTTFDFSELKTVLEEAGFQEVVRYDWRVTEHSHFDDHSQAYLPHMDKENGTLISLNVECRA